MMEVQVPPGLGPGHIVQVRAPGSGAVFNVVVPPGMYPGGRFQVQLPAAPGPPPSVYLNGSPAHHNNHHNAPITFDDTGLPKLDMLDKILNSQIVLVLIGAASIYSILIFAMVVIISDHEPFMMTTVSSEWPNIGLFPGINTFVPSASTAIFNDWEKKKPDGDNWYMMSYQGVQSMRVCTKMADADAWSRKVIGAPYSDVRDYDGLWQEKMEKCSTDELRASAAICCKPQEASEYGCATCAKRPYRCARDPHELFPLDASTSVQDGWLWDYAICDPDQKSSLGFGPCPVTRKKLMTMRANETKSSYSDEGPNAGEHLFTWLPEPTDPAFRSECMFLYFRFQFPLQLPCEGNGTLGARVALSVARREGFGKVVRFILVSGLYAKMLAILIKFTQAYRAKTTPDNPVANLGLRTQLNTPCAICMIFACFCDRSQTNKNRVAKNVHDAKWAPEEQGCLALTNLLVSLWLMFGLAFTTIGGSDVTLYVAFVLELVGVIVNLKNNWPLRFKAQYPAHCCGLFEVPWCKYAAVEEEEEEEEEPEGETLAGATEMVNPSFGNGEEFNLELAAVDQGSATAPQVPPVPDFTPKPPPASATAHVPRSPPGMTPEAKILHSFLKEVGVGRYLAPLRGLGVLSINDMSLFELADLEEIGLSRLEARRLLKAVGSSSSVATAGLPPGTKRYSVHETSDGDKYFVPISGDGDAVWDLPPGGVVLSGVTVS